MILKNEGLGEMVKSITGSKGRRGVVSQRVLAQALCVSLATVSRWSRGYTKPDDRRVIEKLFTIWNQREGWNIKVLPFVVLDSRRSENPTTSDWFSDVMVVPEKDGIIRYALTIAHRADWVEVVLNYSGPWDVFMSCELKGDKTDRVRLGCDDGPLMAGDVVSLFVHYN